MTVSQKITIEQDKAEVHRFWNAFTSKSSEQLKEFYSPEASVFSSLTSRPEPGRLAAARREREYFHAKATIRASVGMIDVVLLGEGTAAVASYTFQFHASKVAGSFGASTDEDIKNGRATHVMALDPDGKLRIVHEHFSSVDKKE